MNPRKIFQKPFSDFKGASVYDKVVFVSAVAVAVALLVYHGFIHTGLIKFSAGKARDCGSVKTARVHVIEIKDNEFAPKEAQAELCDRLRFVNRDEAIHEPAFGDHPAHVSYPGYEEKGLLKDQNNEFVLTVAGIFSFHDHLDENIEGVLVVSP